MNRAPLHSLVTPALLFTLVLAIAALGPAMSPPNAVAADPPPYEGEWGTPGSGDGEFDSPRGLTVAELGEIFVADTNNHRIQRFDADGTYLGQWGSAGSTSGRFNTPSGVTTVWSTWVLVADSGNDRIQKFDFDGTYLDEWGTSGTGPGQFQYPTGVVYSYWGDDVYVVDQVNNRIQNFDTDGTYITQWGTSGSGQGQFSMPTGIAVDRGGLLYVADTGNDRVQVFGVGGVFAREWGTSGSGAGEFSGPEGIGIDCEGNVYVVDTGNHRIQKFDSQGSFMLEWGGLGAGPSEFDSPSGVAGYISQAVTVGKRALTTPLYVLDAGNSRVQQFAGPCCATGFCDNATVTVAGPATVMIAPSGTGPTLASLGATVTVQILDCCDEGIAGYPFQDIWLDDTGTGDIAVCPGGSVADANTNIDGITTISGAIAGGGWTQDGMFAYLAGTAIGGVPLPLSVNSPDLNGDRIVNLVDLGLFASDYNNGDYDFRSDLTGDGIENLADIGRFAVYNGDECP